MWQNGFMVLFVTKKIQMFAGFTLQMLLFYKITKNNTVLTKRTIENELSHLPVAIIQSLLNINCRLQYIKAMIKCIV